MTRRILILILVASTIVSPLALFAEEGMWLPDISKSLPVARMRLKGLALKPEEIYSTNGPSLKDAVVIIGAGTGSFVSAEGLIITNHHVAFSAITASSTPQTNYIENGFLARSRAEEIPAKGYTVSITRSFTDVTAQVLSAVKEGMTAEERQKAIDARSKELVDAARKNDSALQYQVVDMFNGLSYYLYAYEVLKDVRLVYAPPKSIGFFGGDPDNFEWPRHTGDYAFMRAYVGPDGKPAEYSEKNVPYRPKKFLTISMDGYKDGDFVMVMGYPGSTFRYRESYSIEYRQNRLYPYQIEILQALIDLMTEASKQNQSLAIKYADQIFSLSNAVKNFQGSLQGLRRSNLLERKRADEEQFMQYVNGAPALKVKYGGLLQQFAELYRELKSFDMRQNILSGLINQSETLQLLSAAVGRALDREKAEQQRSPAYSETAIARVKQAIPEMVKQRDPAFERKVIGLFLEKAGNLPRGEKVESIEKLFAGKSGEERKGAEAEFARKLFEQERFSSAEAILKLFDLSAQQLKDLNDPYLNFVIDSVTELQSMSKRTERFNAGVTKLRPLYIEGISSWKKTTLYPDANRTLRFTYGEVKGYKPRDAVWYQSQTTLSGVIEKDGGKEPFDVPERLKQLQARREFGRYLDRKLGDVPVDFISTADITGGNSGSPIMNGRGELIGIIFDGNYEGLGSDYVYNGDLSRAIAVDIRYVFFLTEKFSGADYLFKEMQIRGGESNKQKAVGR